MADGCCGGEVVAGNSCCDGKIVAGKNWCGVEADVDCCGKGVDAVNSFWC